MNSLKDRIKQKALELGFDACGIASVEPFIQEKKELFSWIKKGYNGTMSYLEKNMDIREDINKLGNPVKSAIVVLLNYFPETKLENQNIQIAKYAYGQDYHFIIKHKLKQLNDYLVQEYPTSKNKEFTDSAPIFERQLAQRAGLGWIGKNGLLIHPNIGSYTFIGELLTDIQLEPDTPISNRCGTCTKCLEACPTGALLAPNQMNASQCISYLTIEYKGEIDKELKKQMGRKLYGCDACLDACPWNQKAKATQCEQLYPIHELHTLSSATFSRSLFKNAFKYSAMQRAGYQRIRNRLKELESQQ